MAKTLIGNIKGKNGRGITSIKKTGTTGSVDTYTITYTDNTTSTFTIKNPDSISLQRQIVPSASIESSATASQAYTAGQYVVVAGILRKVTSSIAKGNTISDSNSTATTVGGELGRLADSVSTSVKAAKVTKDGVTTRDGLTMVKISWPVAVSRIVAVIPTYTCRDISDRIVVSDWNADGISVRAGASQIVSFVLHVLYV